jgi:hypothetical protein
MLPAPELRPTRAKVCNFDSCMSLKRWSPLVLISELSAKPLAKGAQPVVHLLCCKASALDSGGNLDGASGIYPIEDPVWGSIPQRGQST